MEPTNEPTTLPEAATADRVDAAAAHDADRPPTPAEERLADQREAEVDPSVAEHYREATERGAAVRGEGEIVPGERS